MNAISLDLAKRIADAAFSEAAARDIHNISVVVTDRGGDIRLAMRSDAQGAFGIATAQAKAQTALGFYLSSWKLSQIFAAQPASVVGINAATGGRFIPIGGAILVCNEEDEVIGAASISGGNPQADHEIITLAVTAAGLSTRE